MRGISVLTAPIPWQELCRFNWPGNVAVLPGGLLICAATVLLLRFTKLPLLLLIVLSAVAGAFFCR